MENRILVTGAAGFIGFHLSRLLCGSDWNVTGIDNLNSYYSVQLKKDRLEVLHKFKNFRFLKTELSHAESMNNIFKEGQFDYVIHLAAQAGVRYSITNPRTYIDSNIVGFLNVIEGCRNYPVKHLIYASSSSVYGNNKQVPYSTSDSVDNPISLYAATKKSNELMAYTYSHLFNIPATGLRFFTVYGPWGRPDMAYFSFTRAILEEKPIQVYNYGDMKRDFTYIDDITNAINLLIRKPPDYSEQKNAAYSLYNIGNNDPTGLMRLIRVIEECIGKKAIIQYTPMQPGDVLSTYADIDDLAELTGFRPVTDIETGIARFVQWYNEYFKSGVSYKTLLNQH